MQEPIQTEGVGKLARRSLAARSIPLALLLLNAIGAVVYLFRASPSWAIPEERAAGIHATTGEPFVWFAGVLPIVAIFFVINLVWGAAILTRRHWQGGRLWLLTAAVWLGAVVIDFAHH